MWSPVEFLSTTHANIYACSLAESPILITCATCSIVVGTPSTSGKPSPVRVAPTPISAILLAPLDDNFKLNTTFKPKVALPVCAGA